jgi:hypothetical protein
LRRFLVRAKHAICHAFPSAILDPPSSLIAALPRCDLRFLRVRNRLPFAYFASFVVKVFPPCSACRPFLRYLRLLLLRFPSRRPPSMFGVSVPHLRPSASILLAAPQLRAQAGG